MLCFNSLNNYKIMCMEVSKTLSSLSLLYRIDIRPRCLQIIPLTYILITYFGIVDTECYETLQNILWMSNGRYVTQHCNNNITLLFECSIVILVAAGK